MTITPGSRRRGGTPPSANPPPGAPAGEPFDPTANVIAMLQALGLRQDDLRHESERYIEARLDGLQREVEIRNACAKELSEAESRRVDEEAALRAGFATELRDAEAKRIDAIRAVDVGAVGVASQRASDQATVLAAQVSAAADASRIAIATAAASATTTLQQTIAPILTSITAIQQAGYQAAGKQSYTDPAFIDLLNEVKQLREGNRQNVGKSEGITASIGMIITIALASSAIVGAVVAVLALHH